MKKNLRKELSSTLKRVVIKLGSLSVTSPSGEIDHKKIEGLMLEISKLRQNNIEVILVSSGAINSGKKYINSKPKKLKDRIEYFQACSSVGQPLLIQAFQKALDKHELISAQVLLTHDDLKNKTRYFNIKNNIKTLLDNGIIPILNENDSVSFEEITVGDNDQLGAMVTALMEADLLLILSEADGLFDKDPQHEEAKHLSHIEFEDNFKHIKTLTKGPVGRGGMKTKLEAVRKLTPLGIHVIISSFKPALPIFHALQHSGGTYFFPKKNILTKTKSKRIMTTAKAGATIKVDEGAYRSLLRHGSLLPIGIKKIKGPFKRGDSIAIQFKNKTFAYGLSDYDSKDVEKIMGKKSFEIEDILGFLISDVVVHRDNMILKD
jgi:glutamate 5-kinase